MRAIMDFNCIHMKMNFGGLSNREYVMLDLLSEYKKYNEESKVAETIKDSEGVRVSELIKCLGISMQQVSRLLGSMESKVYMDNVISGMGQEKTDNLINLLDELAQR